MKKQNSSKRLIILSCIPLLIIGAVVGLVVFNKNQVYEASNDSSILKGKELYDHVKELTYQEPLSITEIEPFWGGEKKGDVVHPKMTEQCLVDEQDFEFVQKHIVNGIKRGFLKQDDSYLSRVVSTNDFKGTPFPSEKEMNNIQSFDGIDHIKWLQREPALVSSSFKRSFQKYVNSFEVLEDFNLDVFHYISPYRSREREHLRMMEAKLLARFDVRGVTKLGERRNDRGVMSLSVSRDRVGESWKLNSLEILEGETIRTQREARFVEATNDLIAGDELPVYLRKEAIRRGGYALAIDDHNGDGFQDMYIGAYGEGVLLEGQGNGKFKRNFSSGLEGDRLVKTAIFADFQNKGEKDLVLVRFVPHSMRSSDYAPESDIVFYKKDKDGKFNVSKDVIKNRQPSQNAMPAAVADFNGNGLLDLYVGFPGPLDFTFLSDSGNVAQKALVQGLYLNESKGKELGFVDRTALGFETVEMDNLFAHSSIAYDYDMNGTMDLIVLDDRGNLSPVYENQGDATFYQKAEQTGLVNSDFGMGISGGDINNDGNTDFAVTSVNFTASERFSNSCRSNWHGDFVDYGKDGLRLFKAAEKGKFLEMQDVLGLGHTGEGLAGVEFVDYDNDGLLDIYVINGLWSGTDRFQDLSSLFVRSMHQREHFLSVELSDDGTQSDFMNILNSFQGDVVTGEVEVPKRPSMAGFQRNRLYRNMGDDKFLEVGYLEGVDSIADGYIAALADLNDDGHMDIVLRNGDPGVPEVHYPAVQIFLNQPEGKLKKSLLVELEGTRSNFEGVGTFVEAHVGERKMTRHLISNNGPSQSQKVLHFGLGQSENVDVLKVSWPSGHVQTLTDVKPGRILIKENISGGEPQKIVKFD